MRPDQSLVGVVGGDSGEGRALARAVRALRRSPAHFVRLIALLRKRVENSSWVRLASSRRAGAISPGRGVKRGSRVSREKRDQGQTSWQMSQPKTQFSSRSAIGAGSDSSRSSIVP